MREKAPNFHHFEFDRRSWTERRVFKLIRDHNLMGMLMDYDLHTELHQNVPPVHPPSFRDAELLLGSVRRLEPYQSPLDAAKRLSDNLDGTLRPVGEHLEKQIPFLEMSTRALKRRVV